jgi:hypothetical protein
MQTGRVFLCALCMWVFSGSACVFAQESKSVPVLAIETVLTLSRDFSAQQGYDLSKYYISDVRFNREKKEWMVFWQGNVPAPGNHFLVMVDEETRKLTLMVGQ